MSACGYTWEIDLDNESECSEFGDVHVCTLQDGHEGEHDCPCGEPTRWNFDGVHSSILSVDRPMSRLRRYARLSYAGRYRQTDTVHDQVSFFLARCLVYLEDLVAGICTTCLT